MTAGLWSVRPNHSRGTPVHYFSAFLYDGAIHHFQTLGGFDSYASAINGTGQVTGWADTNYENKNHHAFLWTPTTPNGNSGLIKDPGTLGGDRSVGFGINALGQVTGYSSVD